MNARLIAGTTGSGKGSRLWGLRPGRDKPGPPWKPGDLVRVLDDDESVVVRVFDDGSAQVFMPEGPAIDDHTTNVYPPEWLNRR